MPSEDFHLRMQNIDLDDSEPIRKFVDAVELACRGSDVSQQFGLVGFGKLLGE